MSVCYDLRKLPVKFMCADDKGGKYTKRGQYLSGLLKKCGFERVEWCKCVLDRQKCALSMVQHVDAHLCQDKWEPLIWLEDDVDISKSISEMDWQLSVPADADAVYLGISEGTILKDQRCGGGTSLVHRVTKHLVRVWNMFGLHAILMMTREFASLFQRCLLEDAIRTGTGWDCSLAWSMAHYNILALVEPLFYQAHDPSTTKATKIKFDKDTVDDATFQKWSANPNLLCSIPPHANYRALFSFSSSSSASSSSSSSSSSLSSSSSFSPSSSSSSSSSSISTPRIDSTVEWPIVEKGETRDEKSEEKGDDQKSITWIVFAMGQDVETWPKFYKDNIAVVKAKKRVFLVTDHIERIEPIESVVILKAKSNTVAVLNRVLQGIPALDDTTIIVRDVHFDATKFTQNLNAKLIQVHGVKGKPTGKIWSSSSSFARNMVKKWVQVIDAETNLVLPEESYLDDVFYLPTYATDSTIKLIEATETQATIHKKFSGQEWTREAATSEKTWRSITDANNSDYVQVSPQCIFPDRFCGLVQANNDVHFVVHLGDKSVVEVVIGGWSNTQGVVRRKIQSEPTLVYSKSAVLARGWNAFCLYNDGGTWTVSLNGNNVFSLKIDGTETQKVVSAGIHTGWGSGGIWKILVNDIPPPTTTTTFKLDEKKQVVTCKLAGRFGNQLWQIANTIAYAKRNQLQFVFIKDRAFHYDAPVALDSLPFLPTIDNAKELGETVEIHEQFPYMKIKYNSSETKKNIVLCGLFQDVRYLDGCDIQKELPIAVNKEFKNWCSHKWASKRLGVEYCAVHVRRGDYVQLQQYHPLLKQSYYEQGFNKVQKHAKDVRFVLFSDDVEWCSKQKWLLGCVVAPGENSFAWMMQCDHFVIANSSFSWWAACLGKSKTKLVCYPKEWFGTSIEPEKKRMKLAIDRRWIAIEDIDDDDSYGDLK